jgi:hypothetical protein
MFNGRRQPSCGGTSRISREAYVRFCEGLGVKFPGPTRQARQFGALVARGMSAMPPIPTELMRQSKTSRGANSGHSITSSVPERYPR